VAQFEWRLFDRLWPQFGLLELRLTVGTHVMRASDADLHFVPLFRSLSTFPGTITLRHQKYGQRNEMGVKVIRNGPGAIRVGPYT
jgi:hypothetical protein